MIFTVALLPAVYDNEGNNILNIFGKKDNVEKYDRRIPTLLLPVCQWWSRWNHIRHGNEIAGCGLYPFSSCHSKRNDVTSTIILLQGGNCFSMFRMSVRIWMFFMRFT